MENNDQVFIAGNKDPDRQKYTEAQIVQYITEGVKICSQRLINKKVLDRVHLDVQKTVLGREGEALAMTLDAYIHGMAKESVIVKREWPETWWDAFKDRWFPACALRRWPAKMDGVDINVKRFAVCPHLDSPERGSKAGFPPKHLQWLTYASTDHKESVFRGLLSSLVDVDKALVLHAIAYPYDAPREMLDEHTRLINACAKVLAKEPIASFTDPCMPTLEEQIETLTRQDSEAREALSALLTVINKECRYNHKLSDAAKVAGYVLF